MFFPFRWTSGLAAIGPGRKLCNLLTTATPVGTVPSLGALLWPQLRYPPRAPGETLDPVVWIGRRRHHGVVLSLEVLCGLLVVSLRVVGAAT